MTRGKRAANAPRDPGEGPVEEQQEALFEDTEMVRQPWLTADPEPHHMHYGRDRFKPPDRRPQGGTQ